MFPKRFRDPKTGFHLLSSMHSKKYLKNIGLEREDYYLLKHVGKGLLCTYAVLGALWLYNENSSLGWWKLKPWLKEHEEALKEFIAKGGTIGTTVGPKGMDESDKDGNNNQKELQGKNFDEEAQKLWLRMKNEVTAELKEKGFDVE
ncbi:cysteine synthase [Spatholobus suberectus]|nr:cysteine synthase [Spatholobus suberectus]